LFLSLCCSINSLHAQEGVYPTSFVVTTLAGQPGITGTANGLASAAQFDKPCGVALDGSGNTYVADTQNNAIREVNSAGVVSTLAGSPGVSGTADGLGGAARFFGPQGIALDGSGNIYVADSSNNTIREINSSGVVSTIAGTPGVTGTYDGPLGSGQFNLPTGVAVDSSLNVYVADYGNNTIRKISGGVVSTLAGQPGVTGTADGQGNAARFDTPSHLALDGSGNIYVADQNNQTIRKITSGGYVSTLAGQPGVTGSNDGAGSAALFNYPTGLAVDGSGNVYVADYLNFTIREVSSTGVVSTLAGLAGVSGTADGTGIDARFYGPQGVAVDGSGNICVADTLNSTMRRAIPARPFISAATVIGTVGIPLTYQIVASNSPGSYSLTGPLPFNLAFSTVTGQISGYPDQDPGTYLLTMGAQNRGGFATAPLTMIISSSYYTFTTLAGTPKVSGTVDGVGSSARFSNLEGCVAVDGSGNAYVADYSNHTIREISSGGVVTTLAGTPGVTGTADGIGSAAQFWRPAGVAVDGSGNVYVADFYADTIRKIAPGGVVTTLAGGAGRGYADGQGSAAQFSLPYGVAVDKSGNLYVGDSGNAVVRKVTSAGFVTTIAGSPGNAGSKDGTGSGALFDTPYGVAVDGNDNIYVTDNWNCTIRKIASGGVVTTISGTPRSFGYRDGPAGSALFSYPLGIAVDVSGNLYVADSYSDLIRKITNTGIVSTVGGSPYVDGDTDGTGAGALFDGPSGIAVDGSGNLYVGDDLNFTVRLGTPSMRPSQSITFTDVPNLPIGAHIPLSATASSGAPAAFTVISGPALLMDGNILTVAGIGNITLEASQGGTPLFGAASAIQSLTVLYPGFPERLRLATPNESGVFDGMLGDGTGYLSINLSNNDRFTGSLTLDGASYSFTGAFNQDGVYNGTIHASVPISLALSGSGTASILTGTANGVALTAYHTADRIGQVSPEKGNYTLLLSATGQAANIPPGTGFGTMAVSRAGGFTIGGRLADGEAYSASGVLVSGTAGAQAYIYKSLTYPYATPRGARGSLFGRVTFTGPGGGFAGTVHWIKPQQSAGEFQAPIDTTLNIAGSPYKFTSGGSVLPGFTAGTLELSDTGALSLLGGMQLDKSVTLTPANAITVGNPGPDVTRMRFVTSTGLFVGSFVYPGAVIPTAVKGLVFQGVVLQSGTVAGGFFLGPDGGGNVSLK